jgi:ribonucleotide reductase alpha subunit
MRVCVLGNSGSGKSTYAKRLGGTVLELDSIYWEPHQIAVARPAENVRADLEAFIAATPDPGRLRMFYLSVLVTDAFMDAVAGDRSWNLVFDGRVYRSVSARALWDQIMRATYAYAEPGVIFIDRINARNNLA